MYFIQEELNTLRSLISEHSSQRKKILTMLKQNPKSIKLYEPNFDETYVKDIVIVEHTELDDTV